MRLIPGKIKVKLELFKKVSLADLLVTALFLVMILFVAISSLPGKLYICAVLGLLAAGLLARIDTVPNYIFLLHILRYLGMPHHYGRLYDDRLLEAKNSGQRIQTILDRFYEEDEEEEEEERGKHKGTVPKSRSSHPMEDIIAFTDIKEDRIEYGGKYYGAAIEIPPIELRFFSQARRINTIENSLGRLLRTLNTEYSANIVKLERPIMYDRELDMEYDRLDELRASYENGLLKEEEYQARVELLFDRIHEIRGYCFDRKVVAPYYCLVLYESDKRQLENQVASALRLLQAGEMKPHRLNTKELAVFLKYTNQIDFDERSIEKIAPEDYAQWAMPMSVDIRPRSAVVNHIISYTTRMVGYPSLVGDAWLAGVMSMPGTKCVVKCRPMDRTKAIHGIDRSLQELRGQMMNTGVDSRRLELQEHIDTLSGLLTTLQRENEALLEVNVYVTAYDIAATRASKGSVQPPKSELPNITNMKKAVRRLYQEAGFRLSSMEFDQTQSFIGSQISGWDPMLKDSRGIPSNSLAACYPWIYAHISDKAGFKIGSSDGVPVMIDFFQRDTERVNSNLVIVGKSGSGKSYATKSILENLAAENCKIFILDPENEYAELAGNLHGKFINVGNAQFGRLNPFQIITALDDEDADSTSISGSYATHLQFLEEFFRQILPDCDKDAMEYLNNMIDRMYFDRGITAETDLSKLKPEDYPIFDDLYDAVMQEFQQTDNEYIRSILRVLMNYIAKFSTGGRNANIWNGPSTITTDENFTVFNFQSLLANRNSTIANAQMLLVLKYIDNEIIKNRDYNLRYHLNRKVAVVIDEAHVFIDNKFPVALDFMFQLAKRIRKYNGMQIVITQNIKDFVGSEEIARKSTAIINACQYSMVFSLAPNDIEDLCKLYEKAGGINEQEQEEITSAPRGQAFVILGPSSRTAFQVEVREDAAAMFNEPHFQSRYFTGADGAAAWDEVVGDSRLKHQQREEARWGSVSEQTAEAAPQSYVTFTEIREEDLPAQEPQVSFREVSEPVIEKPQQVSFREETVLPMEEGTVHFTEEIDASAQQTAEIPEIPVPNPAAEQTAPAQSGVTEKLLTELLEKFSYDTMMEEIRRTVREEVAREMAAAGKTASAPAAEPEAAAPQSAAWDAEPEAAATQSAAWDAEPEEETGYGYADEELPEEAYESEDTQEPEEAYESEDTREPQEEAEPSIEEEEPFDIMALLAEQAEQIQKENPIDQMLIFDEEVIDVSIEELIQYNRSRYRNNRKQD